MSGQRGSFRPLQLTGAAFVLVGCGSQSTPTDDLPRVLNEVAHGSSVFSYAFVAEPPEGQRLRVAMYGSGDPSPCMLAGDGSPPEDDFSYLRLELGGTDRGSYSVVQSVRDATDASIQLSRIENGVKVERSRAIRGSVVLQEDASGAPSSIRGRLRARFPATALEDFRCDASGAIDGPTTRSCWCRFADGNEQTCVPEGDENCCSTLGEDTVELEASFNATYCAELCSVVDFGLSHHCDPMQ